MGHVAVGFYINQASSHSVTVRLKVRIGRTNDLSDFARGTIIDARHTSSRISETAGLLGFSYTTVPEVYREW